MHFRLRITIANTDCFLKWSLRRKSQQDLDSAPGSSKQRHLRARAHSIRLHREHIPGAFRHGSVRRCGHVSLPLVRSRHHSSCSGPQRNHMRFGSPHIRHQQLSGVIRTDGDYMCADQEYFVIRNQLRHHAVAAVQQLSDGILHLSRHRIRLECEFVRDDKIRSQDKRSNCGQILARR